MVPIGRVVVPGSIRWCGLRHDNARWFEFGARTQNPVRLKPRVGSTLTSGTIFTVTCALGPHHYLGAGVAGCR